MISLLLGMAAIMALTVAGIFGMCAKSSLAVSTLSQALAVTWN